MTYLATYIYWAIVALWLTVLSSVIYYYARNPRAFGTTRLLLAVIGIDTIRNIAENMYFGFYFGGKYGVFPAWIAETLGQPELLVIPKFANMVAGCVVLGLLMFHWLAAAGGQGMESYRTASGGFAGAIRHANFQGGAAGGCVCA